MNWKQLVSKLSKPALHSIYLLLQRAIAINKFWENANIEFKELNSPNAPSSGLEGLLIFK